MSDPQMAVLLICTMASCGFRIRGSGTVSTPTLWMPFHQTAFISPLLLYCGSGVVFVPPRRSALGSGHLARLHDRLEPAQVVLHLLKRLFAEHLRHQRSICPAGGRVVQADLHLAA